MLRRGVRLSYDKTRGAHVLLFPEGVLVPNSTAVAVLELCIGKLTVAEIALALRERYDGVREQDVADIVNRLADRRVLEFR